MGIIEFKYKICTGCKEELPATLKYFYKQKNGLYGLESKCKKCKAKVRCCEYTGIEKPLTIKDDKKLCTKCKNWFPATIEFFTKDVNNKTGLRSRGKCCTRKKVSSEVSYGNKTCTKCLEVFPATLKYFNKNGNFLKSRCKWCCKENLVEYYNKNYESYVLKVYENDYWDLLITPKYASRYKMGKIFKKAKELSKKTGIKHHVDHIDPRRNDLICGFHIETNLQILTAEENLRKSNKFTPYRIDQFGVKYLLSENGDWIQS